MKYFILLLILIFSFQIISAQDTSKTELKHGILFQIDNLFTLNNFKGYTFAYQYMLDKESKSLRFGITTYSLNRDREQESIQDTLLRKSPNSSTRWDIKLAVDYLNRMMQYEKFHLYVGAGPFIGYQKRYDESKQISPFGSSKDIADTKTLSVGLNFILNVEYQLDTNVFLSGEYNISTSYSYSKTKSKSTLNDVAMLVGTTKAKDISFGGSNASLGLAIFF
ncbi:MAG: hypothetical protein CR986_00545 [Ignavibacteriae bacterium]|nr:MAG: hypothetical protein CR986_00545 [Ignavibacteriota bacterium]